MDLQSIDPRAATPAANGRDKSASSGGAFQGVMQMMAEIAANRSEHKAPSRGEPERVDNDEPHEVHESKDRDDDESRTEAADARTSDQETTEAAPVELAAAPVVVPPTANGPANGNKANQATVQAVEPTAAPAGNGEAADAANAAAQAPAQTPAPSASPEQSLPQQAQAPQGQAPQGQAEAQAATTPPAAPRAAETAAVKEAPVQPAAPKPAADPGAALARQAQAEPPRAESGDPAAKTLQNATTAKSDGGSGRGDALMGAKVTVETPTPVARSQGVSSAVLVQAQQAAAGAQPQALAAGNATPLHVGANQPTFVGADGASANNQSAGNQAGGQNSGAQNNGAQNNGNQNNGQGGAQANQQQVGVSFGATIGQRGFGGEQARAQFQQILATRTARPQPAALASGEAPRPYGATTTTSTSTPMTMAGIGGPQSTHTSASSVNRAAATAHGRPGANVGTPADQVAVKLSSTAKDGGGRVTIRLNPEELGKVDIKMEIAKDGMVRAVVAVEKPETLELLQKDAKGLEKALQDAGLQTDGESLEFDLRGDGGQFAGDAEDEAGKPGSARADAQTQSDDGDVVANEQDDGSGGVKADGSLDLVA